MAMNFGSRLMHAWNAFTNRNPTPSGDLGDSYYHRPDRVHFTRGNERSIATAVYNRIAMDVASVEIKHVRLDENGRYTSSIDSGLNSCLNLEANIDQTGRAFIQDIVMSMLDEGCVAVVPVDTSIDPRVSSSYDILSMRTAKIIQWYPQHVRVQLYDDRSGQKKEITLPKSTVAIIENPLYAVINEPNSTMQRLIRKLSLLDVTDEQTASGKLDLIIQLPYIIKTQARRDEAERRRKEIEEQLSYISGKDVTLNFTPHLIPMNRGILVTAYAKYKEGVTKEQIREAYVKAYQDEYFVRVLDEGVCPETKWVEGSNFVDVNVKVDERTHRVIMMGAMDNITKGAAGQAVQNMNLMFGFDEAEGLRLVPMVP